jgi:EAL domain-containing protein (putative c-di-GMP-specific phosphodiesterase class I)
MASELISQYIARLPETQTGASSLRRLSAARVAGCFRDLEIASAFQPVFHADGSVFGHTARVRCQGSGGATPSPRKFFELARGDSELVRLDRLCRTVHAINYFVRAPAGRALILTVDPRLLAGVPDQHGSAFERVLTSLGIATDRVIIEIPAAANGNPALVAHVVANYHFRRYRVAVHYEGDAGWLATLAHLRAAFVIVPFVEGRADILRTSLSAARATGGCVLVTKLESAASLAAAREAAADLFQGLGLAGPGPDPIDSGREETGSTGTLPADRN